MPKKIIKTASHGYVLRETGRQRFRVDELSNYVFDGFIERNGRSLLDRISFSEKKRIECESLFKEEIQRIPTFGTTRERVGLSGWYNRWRGNDNNFQERKIHSSINDSDKHIESIEGMASKSRLLICGENEQSWQKIFLHDDQWLGVRSHFEEIASISRNQETARSVFNTDNRNSEDYAISWADSNGRNGSSCERDFGIERARFSIREGSRELSPVFDLVTEFGSYFANDILTHNCDYIVNWTLINTKDSHGKSIGRMIEKVPPVTSICYDPDYTDEFSVEELYALLEKKQVKIQMPLDMHLDGDGGGDGQEGDGKPKEGKAPGGPDGDQDGDGKDEKDGNGRGKMPKLSEEEKDAIRENIRASLIQAAQQQANLEPGSVPAGIQRLIDRLLEPKIDWRHMLDNVLRSAIKYDYTYTKKSRRSYGRNIILPGRNIMDKVEAFAWLDGSGSTTQEMVTDFLSECKGIMNTFRDYELTIGTFDTEVYGIVKYTPDNADEIDNYPFKGGGGTAPSCCWDYMKEHEIVPHKILLFTDGYVGSDWGEEDYADTLFIIHSNPRISAPYGQSVHYEGKND